MNIVITGASAGIGYALAQAYAMKGNTLGLLGRNSSKLASIAEQCRLQGAQVETVSLDVVNTQAIKDWLLAFDAENPIDLLIANAGVTSIMPGDGGGETWQSVKQVLDINIDGLFNTVFPVIEPMRRRRQGHIVVMSSLAAFRAMPVSPAYCASKSAVKAYGEALRGWLRHDGVKVTVVCPGFIKSDLSDHFPDPKLLMMSADKAAKIIVNGISRNKAMISFPFPLDWGMRVLDWLPAHIGDWVLDKLNYGAIFRRQR